MQPLRRIIVALCLASLPVGYASAEETMQMFLSPHCAEEDRSLCTSYTILSPTELSTSKLSAGDILDIDVVVKGSNYKNIRSVRSWLEYDPTVLEGRSIEISDVVTAPTPGEQTFDAFGKFVKIGGDTTSGFVTEETVIARVTFRVLTTTNNTTLRFNNYRDDGLGHTAVNGPHVIQDDKGVLPAPPCIDVLLGCQGTPQPLLVAEPSVLIVSLKDESTVPDVVTTIETSQTSSSESSVASSVAASTPTNSNAGSAFGILQVQGLRVTTKDSSIFLGWNELKSSALKGYNVYYGTVSGRYLQRRSVPATPASLVLRDLEIGTTYFIAVRGVSEQDQESVFSQEVSITIGKPETASSPLLGSVDISSGTEYTEPTPTNLMGSHNGQNIGGNTGVSSTLFTIAGLSGLVGTFFAYRRQAFLLHHAK